MTEIELSRLFFAVFVLLVAALGSGYVFDRLGMPRVIGEITGGLLLGPSVLGWVLPGAHGWLFAAEPGQKKALEILYWIGLVLLMFTSGFRIQRNLSPQDRRTIAVVLFGATIPPFFLGFAAPAVLDMRAFMGEAAHLLSFQIVVGIAVSVTSIPVISKIFLDLGIMETRFAKIVLGCATFQDLALWAALAVATGLAAAPDAGGAQVPVWSLIRHGALTTGFIGLSFWLAPSALPAASGYRFNLISRASPTGYTLAICFLFAAVASILGVNAIFGAFIAGIAVGALPEAKFGEVKARIAEVSLAFFVPIYFAIVGLKIDLPRFFDPAFTFWFILLSTMAEFLCTMAAAKWVGRSTLTSINLGMAMNTRGGPGIVLASVAYGYGVINGPFFAALVTAAVITSLISGAWFRYVLRRGLRLYD